MKPPKKFWIKERINPQLGTYYIACGQMSKTAAKKAGRAIYGDNVMHGFDTGREYNARLDQLRKNKEQVE